MPLPDSSPVFSYGSGKGGCVLPKGSVAQEDDDNKLRLCRIKWRLTMCVGREKDPPKPRVIIHDGFLTHAEAESLI